MIPYNKSFYTQSQPSYTYGNERYVSFKDIGEKLDKATCKLPWYKNKKECKEIEMKEKLKEVVEGKKEILDVKLTDDSNSLLFSPMINKNNSFLMKISQAVKDIKNDLSELEEDLLFTDLFVDCSVREEFLDNVEII